MQTQRSRFRNKVMLLCGLLTAGMIAAPGAFARDHDYSRYSGHRDYDRHGWHDRDHGNNVGALLAGAIIGGVIVNAIDHSHDYSRTYYAPPSGYYYNGGYGYNGNRYYDNGDGGGYYGNGYGTTYYGNGYAPTYYQPAYSQSGYYDGY